MLRISPSSSFINPVIQVPVAFASTSNPTISREIILSAPHLRRQVESLRELEAKLGIQPGDYDSWYKVRARDVDSAGGKTLLSRYSKSVSKMLRALVPDHPWDETKFLKKPQKYWISEENKRDYIKEVGKKLGITEGNYEKWYKVHLKDLRPYGMFSLMNAYQQSVSGMLMAVFPEHNWDITKFQKKPQGYWDNPQSQREFLAKLAEKLGFKADDYESWYKVQLKDLQQHGGLPLVMKFGKSVFKMLTSVFPEHEWDPMKLKKKPQNFWESTENQRRQLLAISEKLGITEENYEKWYKVHVKTLGKYGGRALLYQFNDSIYRMLTTLIPEHQWEASKFQKKPHRHWDSALSLRTLLIEVGAKLGIKEGDFDAWYKIQATDLARHVSDVVLRRYSYSVSTLVETAFPEHAWDEMKFARKSSNFWDSRETQKDFLIELARTLGHDPSDMEAWYKVRTSDFKKHGGVGLLKLYGESPRAVITSLFPEHPWQPWRFYSHATSSFWNDIETLRLAAKVIEEKNGIANLSDWYRLNSQTLVDLDLKKLIRNEALLIKFLSIVYPGHEWQDNFSLTPTKTRNTQDN